MLMKKNFMIINVIGLILCCWMICGPNVNVWASEVGDVLESEYIYQMPLEKLAEAGCIAEDELVFLENDDAFVAQYELLTGEGWELTNVEIEEYPLIPDNVSATSTTSTYASGKIVTSSYVQPEKTKKYYNNKVYATANSMKSYISLAASVLAGKVAWVASTLFSIPTENLAPCFQNGYQTIIENETLFVKTAYYYNGSRYYSVIKGRLTKSEFWLRYVIALLLGAFAKVIAFSCMYEIAEDRMLLRVMILALPEIIFEVYLFIIGIKRFHDAGGADRSVCFMLCTSVCCYRSVFTHTWMESAERWRQSVGKSTKTSRISLENIKRAGCHSKNGGWPLFRGVS